MDVAEGQIYKEFDRAVHVVGEDVEVGADWERIRVIDHGYTNPTCCLFVAVDFDGRLHVYDEHYQRQLTVKENADIIHAMDPDFDGITLADPSIFNTSRESSGGKPWSVADEYREHGITCISPYSVDGFLKEGLGINLVKQRLKEKSLKFKWRDIPLNARSANAPEIPVDCDNHAMDCLRYVTVWRPPGSARPRPKVEVNSLRYWIEKRKAAANRRFAGW